MFFFLNFLVNDTSLNDLFQPLKLYRHGVKVQMEGTVTQFFFKCPSFGFMKSRKKCLKNTLKVSRFFKLNKNYDPKKNLRHSALQRYIFDISEKN